MWGRNRAADGLPHVNPLVAVLYLAYGPADCCCGGEVAGSRWDPAVRQAREQARRAARLARRAA